MTTTRAGIPADSISADDMPEWQRVRRERIVQAALELLEQSDYDRIQIRDVAERGGVALGTLYRYFRSKEHLYAAVMLEWAASFDRHLRRRRLEGTPPERLKQVIRRVIRAFERQPQFLRLEAVLENSRDDQALAIFEEVGAKTFGGFLEALKDLPQDQALRIVQVVTGVLGTHLHQYALGRFDLEKVYDVAAGAVDLIFSPPPQPKRASPR